MHKNSNLDLLLLGLIFLLSINVFCLNYKIKKMDVFMNSTDVAMLKHHEVKIPVIIDNDLVSFSIANNSSVHGILSFNGVVQGGYFSEGSMPINVLDFNKNLLKNSNVMTKSDWMTSGPVNFEGKIDFSGLPKGPAFIELKKDNPSGLPEYDKSILIPIIIQ